MIVGIDGHALGSRSGGNETHTRQLVEAMLRNSEGDRVVVFTTHHDFDRSTLEHHERGVFQHVGLPGRSSGRLLGQLGGYAAQARRHHVDVMFSVYWAPFWMSGSKLVQLVHDVGHRYHPEHFTRAQRAKLELAVRTGVGRAAMTVTLSQHARQCLLDSYALDPERVQTIEPGIDLSRFNVPDPGRVAHTLKRLAIAQPYILYVGNLMPRKNLETLVRAYEQLRRDTQVPHSLVIVGRKRWLTDPIFRLAQKQVEAGQILFTDYVPAADLPALYAGADLHVQPSLFEGFGLTTLESMACGTPVAASRRTALPEAVGDAGLLFDPTKVDDMAESMARVLTDPQLASELRTRGLERVKQFSWERCAERHLQLARQLVRT